MSLSLEQTEILKSFQDGENIFITGPGGTGKSFLIRYFVQDAKIRGLTCGVTALTGCAAILLECKAKTIHSWSGIGYGDKDESETIKTIQKHYYYKKVWRETDVLIIDEVSMMSLSFFELLNKVGKSIRNSDEPFGGIQVVFCGDFFQLPPVGETTFCFESTIWNETFDAQYLLDKSYRQKDELYVTILNQIREGYIEPYYYNILKKRVHAKPSENMITKPVILHPTKYDVDVINHNELENISNPEKIYQYILDAKQNSIHDIDISDDYLDFHGRIKKVLYKNRSLVQHIHALEKNTHFNRKRIFKVGAQVMCTANINLDDGICNGSVGIIIEMRELEVIVRFNNKKTCTIGYHAFQSNTSGISFLQIPLMLAWAVTIHKSQGATLDYAEIDVGDTVFAEGQTYVALSRVKSIDGIFLKSLNKKRIKVNEKVVEFYKQFYE